MLDSWWTKLSSYVRILTNRWRWESPISLKQLFSNRGGSKKKKCCFPNKFYRNNEKVKNATEFWCCNRRFSKLVSRKSMPHPKCLRNEQVIRWITYLKPISTNLFFFRLFFPSLPLQTRKILQKMYNLYVTRVTWTTIPVLDSLSVWGRIEKFGSAADRID